MDVFEAIRARKSVRSWADKPVEKEKLDQILEAARLAPSANNKQEWRFVVVTEEKTRKKLSTAANGQSFVGAAPVVIAACAKTDKHVMPCGQLCYPIDLAIALDHITLAAVELGLGTCWIGAFKEEEVKKILGIPKEIRVVELMPLGYPADPEPRKKSRLDTGEIVHREKW